jgi:hypothetical protein
MNVNVLLRMTSWISFGFFSCNILRAVFIFSIYIHNITDRTWRTFVTRIRWDLKKKKNKQIKSIFFSFETEDLTYHVRTFDDLFSISRENAIAYSLSLQTHMVIHSTKRHRSYSSYFFLYNAKAQFKFLFESAKGFKKLGMHTLERK